MNEMLRFFREDRLVVGVVGLGYVGLPLAVEAASRGLGVVGYDVDQDRVTELAEGRSPVEDVSPELLKQSLASGLTFTIEPSRLKVADAVFVCVPTPLSRHRQPDLSHIETATDVVASVVGPGTLVSLESTSYPGTTRQLVVPALEEAGFTVGEDVFVSYSPERVNPGRGEKLGQIPKVVGGVDQTSAEVAAAVYSRIFDDVYMAPSAEVAEMSKLLENTYRSVNIALVNEMALLAKELDIDIWEVIDAAGTKPFGFHTFYPGPGVGGHCIPLDPHYLTWRAQEVGFSVRFIDVAEQVNGAMPGHVAMRAAAILNGLGRPVKGTDVLGIGVAYKRDVADARESPAVAVLRILQDQGANVAVHDPLVKPGLIESLGFRPINDTREAQGMPLAVVLTDHSVIDYEALADSVTTVFDTRNAYRTRGIAKRNVVRL